MKFYLNFIYVLFNIPLYIIGFLLQICMALRISISYLPIIHTQSSFFQVFIPGSDDQSGFWQESAVNVLRYYNNIYIRLISSNYNSYQPFFFKN